MDRRKAAGWALLLAALSFLPCEARRSPVSGRVRVIYCGDPTQNPSPYPFMRAEPLLDVLPIASSHWGVGLPEDQIKRYMRIYWPRTSRSLLDKYDVVILSDANIRSFEVHQLDGVRVGVVEHGLGFVMIGGGESFKVESDDWGMTPVGDIIPVQGISFNSGAVATPRIVDDKNEFIQSLPMRELEHIPFFGHNVVRLKEGSKLLAEFAGRTSNPFLVYNDYGAGRSFAMTGDWTMDGGRVFISWDYYGDFAVNVVLYVAKEDLPSDIELVHRVRERMHYYENARSLAQRTLEFIEKFGANPRPAEVILSEAEDVRRQALGLYIQLELGESLRKMDEAIEKLGEAERTAAVLKSRALFWVFVAEWLTVSGTAMLSAVILYSLMVRRRMYRQVAVTGARKR